MTDLYRPASQTLTDTVLTDSSSNHQSDHANTNASLVRDSTTPQPQLQGRPADIEGEGNLSPDGHHVQETSDTTASSSLPQHANSDRASNNSPQSPINESSSPTGMTASKSSRQAKKPFAWSLELGATLLSIACMSAIIAILKSQDGMSLASWNFPASLNTILSILGAISRASLAFAISACLGQQKWNWLRRKNDTARTFQIFDEASRGPWGSGRLIFHLYARFVVPSQIRRRKLIEHTYTGLQSVHWSSLSFWHSILSFKR